MQQRLHKSLDDRAATPNLLDYASTRAAFSWDTARAELDGLPSGQGLNIAHEAVDRHANGARRDQVALRWLDAQGQAHDYRYGDLKELSNRFANVLQSLGMRKGDAVFTLAERIPELYISALGSLKTGCVFCALFSDFGPEPIATRLRLGKARVLVTTESLYQHKVKPIRDQLADLEHVLLVSADTRQTAQPNTHDFRQRLASAQPDFTIAATDPDDIALLHFTSGTTGTPKGALHAHKAVLAHHVSAQLALDLHPGDVYWCSADPGWVTGISYGLIAPLSIGATMIVDSQGFNPERWYRILEQQKVNVWYTAPTAIRMLMATTTAALAAHDFSQLRFLASVGEALNPDAVVWGLAVFKQPFHDNWWQTETGAIMIANYAAMAIKPGSMGKPLPGIEAALVRRTGSGGLAFIEAADAQGELALRSGWPSMFRAYLNQDDRYQQCFVDGWYLSGDLAKRDQEGYFWFVGRADDVIKSAGHLIGPFEVETALLEHPAVAEAGVVGIPNAIAGEIVKAFVTLKPGYIADAALRRDLLGFSRKRLGPAVAPKQIEFLDQLPKTRSGKILRRQLKKVVKPSPPYHGETKTHE